LTRRSQNRLAQPAGFIVAGMLGQRLHAHLDAVFDTGF
jgi:hypothetical protein